MKKSTISVVISFVIVGLIVYFIGYKIIASPHELTDQQVLERFAWTLKAKNIKDTNVKFSKTNIIINNKKYQYSLNDDNDEMKIYHGLFKGQYDLSDDTVDYILTNENKNSEFKKIHLIRQG